MRWAQQQRLKFIATKLSATGFLNRRDLQQEFDISIPQASVDLKEFHRLNPATMRYNASLKRYERVDMKGTFHCPICMRDIPHEHRMVGRWIGVDFDGTLAQDRFDRSDPYEVGAPIEAMALRVKEWIAKGYEVRIFTARMAPFSHTTNRLRNIDKMREILKDWSERHIGRPLEATNMKDGAMEVLWDDRAVRVIRDTGLPAEFVGSAQKMEGKS